MRLRMFLDVGKEPGTLGGTETWGNNETLEGGTGIWDIPGCGGHWDMKGERIEERGCTGE